MPVDDLHSQGDLVEDGWRGVELFHIMGREIMGNLVELSPHVRAYNDADRAGVLKIIHDVKWTSRLFVDKSVPLHLALQHKYAVFESCVADDQPTFVYEEDGHIMGFVQLHQNSVALIASVKPGGGAKLLDRAIWSALSRNEQIFTAGTSADSAKMSFYSRNGFEVWESYVTFHKWKDGVKPSLPSCKPDLDRKGSRRKPSAKLPVNHS